LAVAGLGAVFGGAEVIAVAMGPPLEDDLVFFAVVGLTFFLTGGLGALAFSSSYLGSILFN
jgi:hypothetical protein